MQRNFLMVGVKNVAVIFWWCSMAKLLKPNQDTFWGEEQ